MVGTVYVEYFGDYICGCIAAVSGISFPAMSACVSAGGVVVGALRAAPTPAADVVSVAGVRVVALPPPSREGARDRIQPVCDVQGRYVGRAVRAATPPPRQGTHASPLKREGTRGALA